MSETVVKFEHVSMEFPGVLANDDVSLEIKKGEVFALVGENGAGKSTLMNILYGINTPTNGEVYVKGRRIEHFSPKAAIERGVGMVHQHFMLVPSFTVAQNIVLSREPRRLGVLFDNKAAEAAAAKAEYDAIRAKAVDVAKQLMGKPACALASAKAAINKAAIETIAAGKAQETTEFTLLFDTHDQKEGMACFLSREKPKPKAVFTNN